MNKVNGNTSDGYHTFDELYHHRAVLFASLLKKYPEISWKSLLHDDGSMYEGYFIAGIKTPAGQYSYHFSINEWAIFKCKEVGRAPKWDGHVPGDVDRLLSL